MTKRAAGIDKFFAALLTLAAKHGWQKLTLEQIARTAKVPPARLQAQYRNKNELLAATITHFDTAMTKGKAEGSNVRERLFDVLMRRLDLMQPYRAGITRIMDAAKEDPALACLLLRRARMTSRMALKAAGAIKGGLRDELKIAGLKLVALYTIHIWRQDESRDMAKTMAALDRSLGYAESVMRLAERFAAQKQRRKP